MKQHIAVNEQGPLSQELVYAARLIADSITPTNALGAPGVSVQRVESLTEAVMDIAGAIQRAADALERLAEAVENKE